MKNEETPKFPVNTLTWKGKLYLLQDDVAELIREIGDTEETDVRNRLETLAKNIMKLKPTQI